MKNMMENKQELNLEEMELANGGCLVCLACIGSLCVWGAAIGGLGYLYNKSRQKK